MSESTAELQRLRKERDAASSEATNARCCVVGLARMISEDWKKGEPPGKFALDLIVQLSDDLHEAEKEALRTADAVVAAYDKQVGREAAT